LLSRTRAITTNAYDNAERARYARKRMNAWIMEWLKTLVEKLEILMAGTETKGWGF
jgi:hypothetical protein